MARNVLSTARHPCNRTGITRMEITINCRLASSLAKRMREAREELARRWLERIAARVDLDPNHVFPTDELLDHVPLLMDRIADYLEDPAEEITADAPRSSARRWSWASCATRRASTRTRSSRSTSCWAACCSTSWSAAPTRSTSRARARSCWRARTGCSAPSPSSSSTAPSSTCAWPPSRCASARSGCAASTAWSRTSSRTASAPCWAPGSCWRTPTSPPTPPAAPASRRW